MVQAERFEYAAITFAALPVGANSTVLYRMAAIDLTKAPISVVLPVPANPLSTNTAFSEDSLKKAANSCNAFSWTDVGSKGNALISALVKRDVSIG